jgi:hypothetical protein
MVLLTVDPCVSEWTRITVLLPVNNWAERAACASCRKDLNQLCNIMTFDVQPRVFVRYFKNRNPNIPFPWLWDDISVISGDINFEITDPNLHLKLLLFETRALNYYQCARRSWRGPAGERPAGVRQ